MSPDANVICIDNSEYMRNADYSPTRFHAFYDCVQALVEGKARDNFESTFALLSLTGFELLCSLTTDKTKVLNRVHTMPLRGEVDLLRGLRTAELVLEQSLNKHAQKRILALIGSPVLTDEDSLGELAVAFVEKKIFVDFVVIGELTSEAAICLQNFVDILNTSQGDGSHLIMVPPGECLATQIKMSEVMPEKQRKAVGAKDLDLDMDPDLAEAIRLSMQDVVGNNQNNDNIHPILHDSVDEEGEIDIEGMTEEQQIEWAMRLSLRESQANTVSENKPIGDTETETVKKDKDSSQKDDIEDPE